MFLDHLERYSASLAETGVELAALTSKSRAGAGASAPLLSSRSKSVD